MSEEITRLGYLMDLVMVTGKEIAEETNIDKTTISKWRNNQRKIKYRSKYPSILANYFLKDEFIVKRDSILAILKEYYPGLNIDNKAEVAETLAIWITEDEKRVINNSKEEDSYKTYIDVYKGINGWKSAIEIFFDTINRFETPQKVILGDFGDVDFNRNKDLVNESIELIYNCVRNGNKVIIIDKVTSEYKPYLTILRWIKIYLLDGVEIYYYQTNEEPILKQSIYGAKNSIAYIGNRIEQNNLCTLYRDRESVDFYYSVLEKILNNSKKMIETIDVSDSYAMVNILEKELKSFHLTYLLDELPTFRNMPLELLESILKENQVEEEKILNCLNISIRRRKIRNRCNYRQIYNLDALEKAINKEYIIDYDLSAIVGKEIKIRNDQLKEQLEYISKVKNTEKYQMVLTSFKEINLLKNNLELIVQEDSIVFAWNSKNYNRRMHCKELSVIGGFFAYMEEVWRNIPPICKNGDWSIKQLKKLIDY